MKSIPRYLILLATFILLSQSAEAQSKRETLEQKRQELRAQIKKINALLSSNKEEKQSIITKAGDLERRIRATEELIKTNNESANLLSRKINNNQKKITSLREELKKLKTDYAQITRRSYKSRSKQSRLMFLFSSENFLQAYKRLQYLKQYADYREEQGEKIKVKAKKLQALNSELSEQRNAKKALLAKNRTTKKQLEEDKIQQEALLAKIRKKGNRFRSKIKNKQQEIAKMNAEIKAIIQASIAKENEKKGSSSKSKFKMTPEAKALAANFKANKGKLPWPVKSGEVVMRFGRHPSPLVPTIPIQSNGIRIVTNKEEPVHAVFDGEVFRIQIIPGANKAVYIRHGNYITIYNNLSTINVHNGDTVTTGDRIGRVGVSISTHRSTLYFFVYKNIEALNPLSWIINR